MAKREFFFVNGDLHCKVHEIKAQDKMYAFNNTTRKVVVYIASDVRRFSEKAFTHSQLSKLLGVTRKGVYDVQERFPFLPQGVYYDSPNGNGFVKWRFYSESDAMEYRDAMASTHRGAPRKDGRITNNHIPTKDEMSFRMRGGRVMYIKDKDEFIPVWRADKW